MNDPIVGHKTFRDGDSHRHEPLRESEAKKIFAGIEDSKKRRAELMPTEQDAAKAMWDAWYRLKELGWKETRYGPTNEVVQLIASRCTEIESGGRMIDAILTNTILPKLSEEYLKRTIHGKAMQKIALSVASGDFEYVFE